MKTTMNNHIKYC